IRPVRPKSVEEQDRQSLLRLRRQLINEQTRLINQTRGLLGEYGQVVAQGRERFIRELPGLLEDAENGLSGPMREL
ncbi:MAG: IS110 family transposase, partial [Anaerolineae bacterium]|nr:IS110 family transposase [Anaerolineae bacterium]